MNFSLMSGYVSASFLFIGGLSMGLEGIHGKAAMGLELALC